MGREKKKRPAVPRGIRRSNARFSEENKENMRTGAKDLFDTMNSGISKLAAETGLPRSTVARTAFAGGKKIAKKRGTNSKNAWVALRMKEVNEGMRSVWLAGQGSFLNQLQNRPTRW
jgi:hypothetical protein